MDKNKYFQAKCIHASENYEDYKGGVTPPIYEHSLFTFPDYQTAKACFAGENNRHVYTRGSNPTIEVLEKKITELELTESTRMFASGMAAITSSVLAFLKAGDHMIVVDNCYSPARIFFTDHLQDRFQVEVSFVKGDNQSFVEAIKPDTKLIYLESPTSVKFELQDLEFVADLARKNDIITIIDNSYSSPYNQNPSQRGIDIIIHSVSKYINGHSDVVAGVVTGRKELVDQIGDIERSIHGGIIGPFEAWLILRGIRTLGVRMKTHNQAGLKVAQYLETHPKVQQVNYPGLKSHPQHQLYLTQMRGSGGLMSFELRDGVSVEDFFAGLKVFKNAVSWGGFESLILHSYLPMKNGLSDEILTAWGISPNLVRLYVGLEEDELLIADLEEALARV